jgi:hypothetical protein
MSVGKIFGKAVVGLGGAAVGGLSQHNANVAHAQHLAAHAQTISGNWLSSGYPNGVYDTRGFIEDQWLQHFTELEQFPEAVKAMNLYNSKLYKVMK